MPQSLHSAILSLILAWDTARLIKYARQCDAIIANDAEPPEVQRVASIHVLALNSELARRGEYII